MEILKTPITKSESDKMINFCIDLTGKKGDANLKMVMDIQ